VQEHAIQPEVSSNKRQIWKMKSKLHSHENNYDHQPHLFLKTLVEIAFLISESGSGFEAGVDACKIDARD